MLVLGGPAGRLKDVIVVRGGGVIAGKMSRAQVALESSR